MRFAALVGIDYAPFQRVVVIAIAWNGWLLLLLVCHSAGYWQRRLVKGVLALGFPCILSAIPNFGLGYENGLPQISQDGVIHYQLSVIGYGAVGLAYAFFLGAAVVIWQRRAEPLGKLLPGIIVANVGMLTFLTPLGQYAIPLMAVGIANLLLARVILQENLFHPLSDLNRKLSEDHHLLRALIDTLPDYIFIKDAEGRFVISNDAHAQAVNAKTPELLIGKTAYDFFPPELAAQYDTDDRAIMASGQALINIERQTVDQAGNRIWVSTTKAPLHDARGKVAGLVGISRNITQRKAAEEALRQSEEQYRRIVETATEGIWVVEGEGVTRFVNQRMADMLGYLPEEMTNRPIFDFLDAENRALQDQSDYKFRRKDGSAMWGIASVSVLLDKMGEYTGVLMMVTDITERKQAESALRDSEERYRALTELISDYAYAYRVEPDGSFVHEWITDSFTRITGYGWEELDAVGTYALYHPDDADKATQQVAEVLQGQTSGGEIRIRTKAGETRWLHIQRRPVWDEQAQRVIRFYGVAKDITERKQAEEALRESETRYRLVAQATNDAIWDWDLLSESVVWSGAVSALFGYPAEAIPSTIEWWAERIHPEDRETIVASLYAVIQGSGHYWTGEYRFQRADGSYALVIDRAFVARADSGRPLRMIGSTMDVTERKQAEEALRAERHLLRILIDNMPDFIYVKDTEGRFVTNNLASYQGFGATTPEELAGKSDFDLMPFEMAVAHRTYEVQVIESGQALIGIEERTLEPGTGRELWVLSSKVPLRDNQGNIFGLVGISRDITERKLADDKLRESETRFRLLFEHSPDAILLIDPHHPLVSWPIVDCNNAACTMNGYSREELIGNTIDLLHTQTADPTERSAYLEHVRREGTLTVEAVHRRKDGTLFHIQTLTALVNLNGRELILGIDRDITERKLAVERLRESEERFRANFEQAAVGVAHTDPEGNWLRVNQKLCEIVGYSYEELMARTWQELTHPDDLALDLEQWRQLLNGDISTYAMEKRYIHKDGSHVWVNLTVSLVRTIEGAPDYFITVIEDISERKRTEEALYQTHLKLEVAYDTFERLIHQIPIGIQIFDSTGQCVDVNQAHLDLFGVGSRDQVVHQFNILEDETAAQVGTLYGFHRALTGAIVHLGDLFFDFGQADPRYTATSGTHYINVSFFPIFDADGQIRRVVALNQDVTERKLAEAQQVELAAERARLKVVERFVQDASHDLRTPLTIMQTSAYLLTKSTDPDRRQQHYLNLEEQIAHITRVLQDFLDLSRLDRLTTELNFEPCDLGALVHEVRGEQQTLVARKGHTVQLNLVDTLPPVMADKTELARALRHLVVNALNYTPDGGTISITTCREQNSAIVKIQDNGIGISREELPYIFERFYRADKARGTDTGGAGLGLTLAKKIIEAHNGRIAVDSTPGEGTTFRVYLPL
jgi:PAS domain S-box-containing protein